MNAANEIVPLPDSDPMDEPSKPQTGRAIIKETIRIVEEELQRFDRGPEEKLNRGEIAGIVFRLRHLE